MRLMNKFFKSNFVESNSNGISYTLLDQAESDGCHLNPDDEDLFPDRMSGSSRSHFIPLGVSITLLFFALVFVSLDLCDRTVNTVRWPWI